MNRFKPKDLREQVAMMIAGALGYESADMVRQQLGLADQIIKVVGEACVDRITSYAREMNGRRKDAAFSDLPAIIRAATGAGS